MTFLTKRIPPPYLVGFTAAVVYGVLVRVAIATHSLGDAVVVMSYAFIVGVPLVVGYLAVKPHPGPSWLYAIWFPWGPTLAATVVTMLIGYEGAICIFMALPLILVMSSLGGVAAAFVTRRNLARGVTMAVVALPLLMGVVERELPQPYDVHQVRNSVDIAAPAGLVWREIVSVREIARAEMPGNPLFLRLGFPRPLSAEIDREEVGGVRRARFAGGVLFLETVTALQADSLLSFTIHAETDSIPPKTLDEHVTIGGPYFDVLRGTYRIEPLGADSVRLHLESELRVSTHFNWYASAWADLVMESIQRNILAVEKTRAEHGR
ncbi:MAG TPA: hypothetical protein VG940_11780 [Gemmatimonadales bacterium]|nr:hypothetical protein [Gemmatimonadales bacterium]